MISSGRDLLSKAARIKYKKHQYSRLCLKIPDGAHSFVFCSQIVPKKFNVKIYKLIKMIGMVFKVVHLKNIQQRSLTSFTIISHWVNRPWVGIILKKGAQKNGQRINSCRTVEAKFWKPYQIRLNWFIPFPESAIDKYQFCLTFLSVDTTAGPPGV